MGDLFPWASLAAENSHSWQRVKYRRARRKVAVEGVAEVAATLAGLILARSEHFVVRNFTMSDLKVL